VVKLDAAAVRAALADPRDVARALGLEEGARREGAGGLVVRCPVHGDRSPSLSLQVRGGTLSARCWTCQAGGDLLWLVAAVERLDVRRDFAEVLKRAAELAGGAVRLTSNGDDPAPRREDAPRLPEDVAAELFGRVCEAGRLGARGVVERYLDGRGLLDAARADGWASVPSLTRMLDITREVWQGWQTVSPIGNAEARMVPTAVLGDLGRATASGAPLARGCETGELSRRLPEYDSLGVGQQERRVEPSGQVSGGFAFLSPEELLVAARLAFWGRGGELVTLWSRHRLVIPWRGPDGRIQALQRRLVDAPRRMRDGREEPRYVLTWAPRWPYGIERLEVDDGTDCRDSETCQVVAEQSETGGAARLSGPRGRISQERWLYHSSRKSTVVFVEGAIDTLAARLLLKRPAVVLGLPGTGGWVSSWAGLVGDRKVFWGLDGDAAGDRKAAQGAIDVAEAQGRITEGTAREARRRLGERLAALADIARELELGGIDEAEALRRREALGPARCVLCGVEAAHLCAGCGRVRPRGKDWGEAWEAQARRR
jgi:hypothetical protein